MKTRLIKTREKISQNSDRASCGIPRLGRILPVSRRIGAALLMMGMAAAWADMNVLFQEDFEDETVGAVSTLAIPWTASGSASPSWDTAVSTSGGSVSTFAIQSGAVGSNTYNQTNKLQFAIGTAGKPVLIGANFAATTQQYVTIEYDILLTGATPTLNPAGEVYYTDGTDELKGVGSTKVALHFQFADKSSFSDNASGGDNYFYRSNAQDNNVFDDTDNITTNPPYSEYRVLTSSSWSLNTWYRIRVVADQTNKTFDLRVTDLNGGTISNQTGIPYNDSSASFIKKIWFSLTATAPTMYLDNVSIYEDATAPSASGPSIIVQAPSPSAVRANSGMDVDFSDDTDLQELDYRIGTSGTWTPLEDGSGGIYSSSGLLSGSGDTSVTSLVYLSDSDFSALPQGSSTIYFRAKNNSNNTTYSPITLSYQKDTSFKWTGASSSAWDTPGNWDVSVVPDLDSLVTIPAGCLNYPATSGDVSIETLTIESGASISLATSSSFSVSGDLSSAGTIEGAGSLAVTGNAAISGAIGSSTPLSALSVGGTSAIGAAVTTSGAQTYVGAVTLGADAPLTSSGDAVAFSSTVTGASHQLSIAGNASFSGTVSGLSAFVQSGASNALTIASSGSIDMTSSNGTVSVAGTTANSGSVKLGSGAAAFAKLLSGTGTVTGGSGAITLTGGITGGSFTESSTTTSVGGDFTPTAFASNDGTVTLTGSGTVGAFAFNGLTLNTSGTYNAAGAMSVATTLALTSGTLAMGTKDLTMSGATSSVSRGTNGYLTSSGIVSFSGTGAQTADLAGSTLTAATISASKTDGSLEFSNGFTVGTFTVGASPNNAFDLAFNAGTTSGTGLAQATTITSEVSFGNSGSLSLGDDAGDAMVFSGGLADASSASGISLAGTISSGSNNALVLNAKLTLSAATAVNPGSGPLSLGGAVDSASSTNYDLTVAGTPSSLTWGGAIGSSQPLGTLTLPVDSTISSLALSGDLVLSSGTTTLSDSSHSIGGSIYGDGALDAAAVTTGHALAVGGSVGVASGTALAALTGPATAATFTAGGDWNVATYTNKGATITFSGSTAATLKSNGETLGPIAINKTNSSDTVTLSGSLKSAGQITLTQGVLAAGTNDISAAGFVDAGSNGLSCSTGQTVTVTGGNLAGTNYYNVAVSGTVSMSGSVTTAGNLAISGSLSAGSNTITVGKNWSNSGTFACDGSTVTFGAGAHAIDGNTDFYNLSETSTTASSSLTFTGEGSFGVSNTLTLTGAKGYLVSIASSTALAFTLGNSKAATASFVNVSHCVAGLAGIVASNSIDSTGDNTNWSFGAIDWTGASSTSTSLGDNWSTGVVPGSHDVVSIPSTTTAPNQPLQTAAMDLRGLTLADLSSTWSNGGKDLTLGTGSLSNAGTFTYTGAGTLLGMPSSFDAGTFVYSGASDCSFDGDIAQYYDLTVSGGTITATDAAVAGNLTVKGGELDVPAGITLTLSGPTNQVTAGTLSIASGGKIAAGTNALSVSNGASLSLAGELDCGDFTNSGTFATSGTLSCAALTSSDTITNSDANTIAASGAVSITGTFSSPSRSTIAMTGAGTTLSASPGIGSLTVNLSSSTDKVSLSTSALSLAGNLLVGTGSLDMSGEAITLSSSAPSLSGTISNSGSAAAFNATAGTTTLSGTTSVTTNGGAISFSVVNASGAGSQGLSLASGAGALSPGSLGSGTALGDVALSTSGALALSAVRTGSGKSLTVSSGALSQSASASYPLTIGGTTSLATGSSDATLTNTANSFSGDVTLASGKNVSITASGPLGVAGTTTSLSGNLVLTATGLLTIGGSCTVASGATATLSGSGVTVESGATVTGPGDVAVAATAALTGAITLDGTLSNGGSSSTGAINLTADAMTITGAVIGGAGAVTIVPASTSGWGINVGGGGTSSALGLSDAELDKISTTGTLTIGGSGISGAIAVDGTATITAASGAVILQNTSGGITVGNGLSTTGDLSLLSTGKVIGTAKLSVNAGSSSLTVSSAGGLSLTNVGNLAATVSLTNATTSDIEYVNNCAMTLTASNTAAGGIIAVTNKTGSMTVGAGGVVSAGTTEAANITLVTPGSLSIGAVVTAGGSGYVSLSAGATSQSAAITAPGGLLLSGTGGYTLNTVSNAVPMVAANVTNAVSLKSSEALTVGSVTTTYGSTVTTSGITTVGGNVNLSTTANSLIVTYPIATNTGTSGSGTVTLDTATGGTLMLGYATAVITTNNAAVTLSKAVTLSTDSTIGSGTATTAFASTIDGAHALKVDGAASFGGIVGSTPLTSVEVTGATTTGSLCAAITTSGMQTYGGAVTIGSGVNFTGGSTSLVWFKSTLGSGSNTTGQSVIVTAANAEFDNAVGGSSNLVTSLDVTAGTTTTGAGCMAITTSGAQTYGGAVTIGNGVNFTGGSTFLVWFKSTLGSGSSSTGQSVTVTTANAEFDNAVGGSSNLVTSLDVTAGLTTLKAGVTTSGLQHYYGAVTVGADLSTITGTGALTFNSAVAGAAYTLTVQDAGSTGTVTFSNTVTLGGLATGAGTYAISMTGTGSVITSLVEFLNQGTVTLGQPGGAITFNGGAETTGNATKPSAVTLYGTIITSNDPLVFDAVTLGAATILNTNATNSAGSIALGAVTGSGINLTLNTGSSADVIGTTVGTATNPIGALALQTIGGTASFSGAVYAASLMVPASVKNVSLSGGSGTITNAVDFLNTGTLALGQASGTLTFNGGLATTGHATNPATVTTYGTILTSDDAINLGAITLGADTTLDTAATSSTGSVTLGAVTGGSYALVIRTGTSSGSVTQSTGTITANKLRIITGGNIGSSTTALSTAVSYFEGEAGGLVNVSNTGDLTEGFSDGSFNISGTSSGSNGDITLITTANLTVSEAIAANGSGAVSLTANSASKTLAANAVVSSASGAMTLTGDVISIGAALTSAGALTLQPLTAGTTVSIGAAGGTFAIDDIEIGYLSDGFSSITIGRSSSGAVTVDTATFKDPITILSGGMVTIAAGGASLSTSKDNASITVTSATGAGIIVNGGIAANGSGAVDINSGAAFTLDSGVAISSSSGTVTVDTTGANTLEVDGSIATAGTGAIGLTGSNAITMGAAGNVQTASGAITINSAAGGVTTHSVTSTGSGQISITATGSSIVQMGSSPLIGYSSGTSLLALTAGTTIGSLSSPLATSIGTLRMTAAGDAYLSEVDGLVLGDGTAGVTNAGGLVSIAAGGTITMGATVQTTDSGSTARAISLTGSSLAVSQNISAANAGTITLIASSGAITRNAGVVGASGSASLLVLSAGTSIGSDTGPDNVADSGWLATDVGTIRATASSGGIYIDEANAIQLADGSGGVSATGNIDVTAAVGSITTGTGAIQSSGGSVYLDASGSSSMLTINDSLGASAIIDLTAPFGITVSGSATVTGGSGLMTFNNAVTHSAGAIAAGAGGIAFIGDYAASNSASLVGNSSGPIAFKGNASFANFSHNSGAIAFTGLTAQSFLTNAQPIYNMGLNNGAKATLSLLDDLSFAAGGALTLEKGTLDAKGYSITLGAALSYGNSDAPALKLSDGTLTGGSYDITVGQGSLDASGIATITTTGALVLTNASSIVSVGSGSLSVGDMTVNDGSFVQTGSNASTVASLTVKNGSCAWDSGTLSSSGSITQTGGSLELGAKTVSATTLGITAGSLALGTATLNLSSSPNVISPSSCTDGVTSSINLNYAGGSLELNTGSSYTVGAIEVNENTSLVSASGGTIGVAKALAIAAGKYLYLDASAGSLRLNLGTSSSSGTLTATGTLQVADSTNAVALAALSSSYPFAYAGTDIAYNGKAITIDDMSASALNTVIDGGAKVSFGGTVSLSSVTVSGTSSTLRVTDNGTLSTGALAADAYTTVVGGASSLIKASGDVSIAGSFSAPIYPAVSTLEMAGTTQALTVASEICNLAIDSGSAVTLGRDLALSNDMLISGSLDVSSANHAIALAGDWTNSGSFIPQAGTVTFAKPTTKDSGVISVGGANSWYLFDCEVPGVWIRFENGKTQSIVAGGTFKIQGSSSSAVVLSRETGSYGADLDWVLPATPDASKVWYIDVDSAATVDMAYVTVAYSDASTHPIAVPDNVSLLYATMDGSPSGETDATCYQWIDSIYAVYSYSEDSDGDGKIDRLRVVAQAALNGDFSNFSVTVTGYAVDTSKGTSGYAMVSSSDGLLPAGYGGDGFEFFIYLVEKGYNDTDAKPTWTINSGSSSLKDKSAGKYKLETLEVPMVTTDTAAPIIAYTLALSDLDQQFFHFSEPVYGDGSGGALSSANFLGGPSAISPSSGGVSETLASYASGTLTLSVIASGSTSYSLDSSSLVYDGGMAPTNYATDTIWTAFWAGNGGLPPEPYNKAEYDLSGGTSHSWPTQIRSSTHRVSDLLISAPPTSSAAPDYPPYFIWPVWAKDSRTLSLSELDSIDPTSVNASASTGIGLIRAFDGSQWLRDQDITVGVKLADAISASALHLYYDSGVSSTYLSTADNKGPTGLWLPTFAETSFSGIVPFADPTATSLSGTAGSGGLWSVDLDSSDSRVKSGAEIQFLLAYGPENTTDPLYCARLDMTAGGTVPADWYRLVKPFSFQIHDVRNQKGSVTVLNNVIDPSKGETVRLSYQIPEDGAVTVTVFTLDGDVVKRLYAGKESAGDYSTYWDGKNLNGAVVARGIYFVRVIGPGVDELRKVLVVRK